MTCGSNSPSAGPAGRYDGLLLVAFGGPESIDDIAPFLARVTAGRSIPPERIAEVTDRYRSVGGHSPLNGRLRSLQGAVAARLATRLADHRPTRQEPGGAVPVPVFWGNRNANPLLPDTIAEMRDAGVRRALAWVASPYASYSTCRQYTENLEAARIAVGPGAPTIDRVGSHHDHPGLIEPAADRLTEALDRLSVEHRDRAHLLFSAHSIPSALAATCDYVEQLNEVARLVAERVDPKGHHHREVVWQSRSGPPEVPWLEPDVGDRIESLAAAGVDAVVVSPIGFPVENFEIAWDLDIEAAGRAERANVAFQRAGAVDDDDRFVEMVVSLFLERSFPGRSSPVPLPECPSTCCPPGIR